MLVALVKVVISCVRCSHFLRQRSVSYPFSVLVWDPVLIPGWAMEDVHPIVRTYFRQFEVGTRYHLFQHENFLIFCSLFIEKLIWRKESLQKSGWKVYLRYLTNVDNRSLECVFEAEKCGVKWVFKRRNLKSRDDIIILWRKLQDLDREPEQGM